MNLINGDSYLELSKIPDKSIDLVVMDPPYYQPGNAGGGAFGGDNIAYYSELSTISHGISNNLLDLLCQKMKRINLYTYCNKKQLLFYLSYFNTKNTTFDLLTWHKSNPIPATSNIYLRDTEFILFFRERGVKLYGNYHTKKTYYVTPINKSDKTTYNHPTVKLVDQVKNFIINSSNEGEIVLDPFMGTGTTGVAAKLLKRDFIGIEINKAYYDTAVNRINTLTS